MAAPYIDEISDWLQEHGPIQDCAGIRACCDDLGIDEEMFFGVLGNAVHKGFVALSVPEKKPPANDASRRAVA